MQGFFTGHKDLCSECTECSSQLMLHPRWQNINTQIKSHNLNRNPILILIPQVIPQVIHSSFWGHQDFW